MHNLTSLKEGWELAIEKKEFKCHKCGIDLTPPFQFCPETELTFCRECELGKLCNSFEKEHEHFNIINVK